MVLTWDQDPRELYPGIKIGDLVQPLVSGQLTVTPKNPALAKANFPKTTSAPWPKTACWA